MECQKQRFSLPDDHHYVNCAYMAPLLKTVETAGIAGIQRKRRPWEISPDHFFEESHQLRDLFAHLIHTPKAENIAILPSTSYGLSTVAGNLDHRKGTSIVIAGEQFPSNVYPWRQFCARHDCQLNIIEAPTAPEGRGEKWNERILDAIDASSLLVALGNVHWADGTLFHLEKIGARAHEADAYFVIDGTQSVGALPLDVQSIRPDAVICSGYKWLLGPYSIALGYFGEKFINGIPIEEGWIERENSEDFSGLVNYSDRYQPGAIRFDVGERSNFILVPMMIEALRQLRQWGISNIQAYCKKLTGELVRELRPYGYQIEEPAWRAHHLFGIRFPAHIDPAELNQRLVQENIHLSLRGSALRISPNVYNDHEDLQALLDVLTDL
ncbi:aminotransferase class V-fold PLP-dependent enzyme [Fodinibius sediminis]|uniref:Selenocysteine lyase/Cysteine desulfurase n=1 Tax=Fodinibius sediminis TaxID=1214077 RepID=A0A521C5Q2_9BACT|nr:aminotransferase class V-fold PLP-dependent enzyme [Fodinibius sediminis]SMO54847.1 Selenocysteine lyase/Cysteine desulfurase [Fodinibius sediminis]